MGFCRLQNFCHDFYYDVAPNNDIRDLVNIYESFQIDNAARSTAGLMVKKVTFKTVMEHGV